MVFAHLSPWSEESLQINKVDLSVHLNTVIKHFCSGLYCDVMKMMRVVCCGICDLQISSLLNM